MNWRGNEKPERAERALSHLLHVAFGGELRVVGRRDGRDAVIEFRAAGPEGDYGLVDFRFELGSDWWRYVGLDRKRPGSGASVHLGERMERARRVLRGEMADEREPERFDRRRFMNWGQTGKPEEALLHLLDVVFGGAIWIVARVGRPRCWHWERVDATIEFQTREPGRERTIMMFAFNFWSDRWKFFGVARFLPRREWSSPEYLFQRAERAHRALRRDHAAEGDSEK